MSLPAASPNDDNQSPEELSLEDFRRLGVRPFECRQTVIRLGALRSTRALAKKQLSAPSEQGARQLSKVITSAYRLLDPRRREDPMQRALVGRIMPQVVSVAGQTRFLSGDRDSDRAQGPIDVLGSQDQHDHFLYSETETPPAWTISLSERDLVERSPTLRRRNRVEHRKQTLRSRYIWAGLVIGGLMFGAIVGLASVGERAWSVQDVPSGTELKFDESEELADSPRNRASIEDDSDEHPNGIDPVGSLATTSESVESEPSIDELPGGLHKREPAKRTPPMVAAPTVVEPTVVEPTIVAPVVDNLAPSVDIARPEEDVAIQPQPVSPTDPPMSAPKSAERFSLPDDVNVRAARRSMRSQIPSLEESIDIAEITDRITQIRSFRDKQTIGSAEHWAATIALVEHQWLVDDIDQVIKQIEDLSVAYAIQQPNVAATTFIWACKLARMPETHHKLFNHGIALADYLLVNESPRECQQVIETLSQMRPDPEQEQDQQRLQPLAESVSQVERLFSATQRWVDQEDKGVLTSDAGVAGRYYCLMLRRWDVGLPWLVAVADTRIARAAQQDLEASDVPSRISAAQRWIEIADRYQGRTADSMRLRGIELMRSSLDESTAISRLEIEREIEAIDKLLPAELRFGRSGE